MIYHPEAAAVVPPANPLVPAWPELIIGTIAFLIVFAVLGKVLLPRIQKTLADRTDAIEGGLKRAEDAQAEAQQVLDQYRQQLADARQEAARLREQAQEQGAAIIADMREVAQTEARRIIDCRSSADRDRSDAGDAGAAHRRGGHGRGPGQPGGR